MSFPDYPTRRNVVSSLPNTAKCRFQVTWPLTFLMSDYPVGQIPRPDYPAANFSAQSMRDGSCDGATSTVARVGRRFVERVDVSYTVYVCEGERVRAGVMRVRSRGEFLRRGYSHTVGKCAPRVQQTEAWCHLQRRSPRATCRSANGLATPSRRRR